MRKRDDAWGARSGLGAGGGAVALMVDLLSGYPTLPESALLSPYRFDNKVRAWRCTEVHGGPRGTSPERGGDPSEVGPHSLRVGAVITLAAEGRCGRGSPKGTVDGSFQGLPRYTPAITQRTRL